MGQAAGPVAASFHNLAEITGIIVPLMVPQGAVEPFSRCCNRFSDNVHRCCESNRPERFEGTDSYQDYWEWEIFGLIDLAPEDLDEEEAMRLTQRMMISRFTLNDMYKQMEMMSKVGTIDKLLSFLPSGMLGGGGYEQIPKQEMQKNLDKYLAIMDSMTSNEKTTPFVEGQEFAGCKGSCSRERCS